MSCFIRISFNSIQFKGVKCHLCLHITASAVPRNANYVIQASFILNLMIRVFVLKYLLTTTVTTEDAYWIVQILILVLLAPLVQYRVREVLHAMIQHEVQRQHLKKKEQRVVQPKNLLANVIFIEHILHHINQQEKVNYIDFILIFVFVCVIFIK